MRKIIILGITTGIGAIAVAAGAYLYNKKIKNKSVDKINEIDEDEIIENDDNKDETVENEDSVVNYEDSHIREFICHIIKNGVSSEEAISVAETIDNIRIEFPEKYQSIKEKMDVIINSEFNLDDCHEFDKENFRFLYSNINIADIVKKKGFEIVALGAEHLDEIMKLIASISTIQMNNDDSALEIVYNVYHLFKSINPENITENTFNEKFKVFVDDIADAVPDETSNESGTDTV